MPPWGNGRSTTVVTNAAPSAATETVVATLTCPTTGIGQGTVQLSGQVTAITGTATTGVTLRVRRNSLAGPQVGATVADTLFGSAAGTQETHEINVQDVPGETAGQIYVLTYLAVGSTGASAIPAVSLAAALSA